jgi:TPR repeat protein
MLILTIVVAAVAFRRPVGQVLVWLGEGIGGQETTETSQTPANPSSSPNALPPLSGPAVPGSPAKSVTAAREARKHNPSSPTTNKNKTAEKSPAAGGTLSASAKNSAQPVLTPMAEVNKTTAPTGTSEPPTDAAATEYMQALQILDDPNRQRELPEAARLLWVAVEKGNSSAEVALAELYRKGKGVTRNCDQARVLLTAAVRKGNAEAKTHLRQLLREGCE